MPPPSKHLKPTDYRVMPWKNGGGSTTEIAREPAAGDAFAWRISVADLKESGPFSAFPGIDRVIVPIAGPAFRLAHGPHGAQALSPLTPYAFSGDWETHAELAGPGRDYNVMVRRGVAAAWVDVLTLVPEQTLLRTYPKETLVVTLLTGEAEIAAGGHRHSLGPEETLLASQPGAVRVNATQTATLILSAIVS